MRLLKDICEHISTRCGSGEMRVCFSTGLDGCEISAKRQHVPAEQFPLGSCCLSPMALVATAGEIPFVISFDGVRKPPSGPDVVYVEFLAVLPLGLSAIPAPIPVAFANALSTLVPVRGKRRERIVPMLRVPGA